jgi:hypothetical protein
VTGLTIHREPIDAFETILAMEQAVAFNYSIQQCGARTSYAHYHVVNDGGERRKVACATKRKIRTEAHAKRKLKELKRAGRTELMIYPCWYSYRDLQHFHLGNRRGSQTYYRSGRIYG